MNTSKHHHAKLRYFKTSESFGYNFQKRTLRHSFVPGTTQRALKAKYYTVNSFAVLSVFLMHDSYCFQVSSIFYVKYHFSRLANVCTSFLSTDENRSSYSKGQSGFP